MTAGRSTVGSSLWLSTQRRQELRIKSSRSVLAAFGHTDQFIDMLVLRS